MSAHEDRSLDRLTVRVVDPFTDEVLGSRTIYDDYCLVTAGHCVLSSVQKYANGTHVIVVKHAAPSDEGEDR